MTKGICGGLIEITFLTSRYVEIFTNKFVTADRDVWYPLKHHLAHCIGRPTSISSRIGKYNDDSNSLISTLVFIVILNGQQFR